MAEPDATPSGTRRTIEMSVLALLVVGFLVVSGMVQLAVSVSFTRVPPFVMISVTGADARTVGIIIAAGLTLIMYSFLYRDNPLFKIAENLYVGVTLGYGAILTWRLSLRPEVYDPLFRAPTGAALYEALLHRTVPIVLGLLLMTRVSRKRGWLSRYAYALIVGWGAGIGIPIVAHSYVFKQLGAAIRPLQGAAAANAPAPALFSQGWFLHAALPVTGAVVILVGTVAVLFYFFFSIEHKRAGGAFSRVGIWFLMVSFGASFGYTVMGRLSLLIGRVRFLLFEWLKLPQ